MHDMRHALRTKAAVAAALLLLPNVASAGPFEGKTINMVIGSAAGGGTDVTGRLVATFLTRHLPDRPVVVVRNMPGASGITAMNHVANQTKPDGLTAIFGATPQVDPQNYRKSNAQYDPSAFHYVGGIGRGGYVMLISAQALPRLRNMAAGPVMMGSVPGVPRNAMQMTMWGIEYLGWNAKWVAGYPGTHDLTLALDRGEIDMTTTGNLAEISERVSSGKFTIVTQTGNMEGEKAVPRPEFANVPVFNDLMYGKLASAVAGQAFQYWVSINSVDKFISLAPGTQAEMVALYRGSFDALSADRDFLAKGRAVSDDFMPMTGDTLQQRVKVLAATSDEATDFIKGLMRKQGLNVD